MTSRLFACLLMTLAFVAGPANARYPLPIVNHPDIPVMAGSGTTPAADAVKKAILAGAAAKGWTVVQQGDRVLQATLVVRGKHTVIVLIPYSAEKYSITYLDSINMNAAQRDGQAVIHPFYNNWVQELRESIRGELLKL